MSKSVSVQVFYCWLIYILRLRSIYQEEKFGNHINRFNLVIFLCPSQARTWISNVICSCCAYVQWEEFEDTKGAIRFRTSKKNRQRNGRKHTHKTRDRVTRIGGELKCSGRVISSCSTSGIHRVNPVRKSVISREWGKGREVFPTRGTYLWSFVTQLFHNGQPSHGGDRKIFEVMTST